MTSAVVNQHQGFFGYIKTHAEWPLNWGYRRYKPPTSMPDNCQTSSVYGEKIAAPRKELATTLIMTSETDAGLLCQMKPFFKIRGEENQGMGQRYRQFAQGHGQSISTGIKERLPMIIPAEENKGEWD